jgi:glycerol-3-phosphate dehydrogenase
LSKVASRDLSHLGNYDVAVIGAGIVGAMIARELSKLDGRFVVLEKESFPTFGVSKASLSQIHLPDFCPPGSLKGKLCKDAPSRFKRLAAELDVSYREVDELWLALDASQLDNLKEAKRRGQANGATGYELIGPQKIRELEPHVTKQAVNALYAKGVGVIYTPEWGFALIENATQNGLQARFGTAVTGITKRNGGSSYVVATPKGAIRARYIVNAAGLYADEIAGMVGDRDFHLTLRKGTMVIFDKSVSNLVRHMIFGTFDENHSQDIAPTVHGNMILGIHYEKPSHKEDTKVSREGIRRVMKLGKELIPALSEKDVITGFSGILADNNMAKEGDFFVGRSERAPGVIHVMAGAPGLTASPSIAELVVGMLSDSGLDLEEKRDFQKERLGWPRFQTASLAEREEMIAANSKYGHLVCRCEQVSEAEISEAIRRGAHTTDAVKHLTRAGMGRCQGGFCGIPVLNMLAKHLEISPTRVTKNGRGSHHLTGMNKSVGSFVAKDRC